MGVDLHFALIWMVCEVQGAYLYTEALSMQPLAAFVVHLVGVPQPAWQPRHVAPQVKTSSCSTKLQIQRRVRP